MAKKTIVESGAEIKKLQTQGKLVLGTKETIKFVRAGKVNKIFFASNCSPQVKSDVEHLCRLGNIECVTLEESNEDIGVLCKKPFAISIVGVLA